MASNSDSPDTSGLNPQTALLDAFFPGFSLLSSALYKYSKIDLSIYIPMMLVLGMVVFASQYFNTSFWDFTDNYLMSTADVRIDDEMYNMLMAWIANQQFAKKSRRFVANTNLNSRMWNLWREFDSDDCRDEEVVELDSEGNSIVTGGRRKKEKTVQFTPSFGTHYFWYKRRLLIFKRSQDVRQTGWGPVSEREEISVQCFGRNPAILKELLDECRRDFVSHDENRTIIYRGSLKSGTSEPVWTRCVSRVARPFSTVVLDEAVKKNLLDDMRDYLHPYTQRWYANRGIPYRRGYLLYGPPGTGKSSLSLAIAGYFKLKIYIVSLNSPAMNEENLGTLFSELPKQCVVLLEDIDTAGLTHTRDTPGVDGDEATPKTAQASGTTTTNTAKPPDNNKGGRISLSALLNIIDGVAATEGRTLILTTNFLEKLDAALIRPGRVDMTIKFDLATTDMIKTIFRGIFATLEGDVPKIVKDGVVIRSPKKFELANGHASKLQQEEDEKKNAAEVEEKKKAEEEKVAKLAAEFAAIIPSMTFSPAEIQGHLLKHKREPERAVANAAEWVVVRKVEQMQEKEKKRQEEKERLEKEEKEKAEKLKEEKEAAEKEKAEKEKEKEEKKPKANVVKTDDA